MCPKINFKICYFSNNDTAWGTLSVALTFAPSVLGFICTNLSYYEKFKIFGELLPGVFILYAASKAWKMLKLNIQAYKDQRKIAQAKTETEREEMNVEAQKIDANMRDVKSKYQINKLFEVLGESGPQFILQVTIMLKKHGLDSLWNELMKEFFDAPWSSTILGTLTSVLSLLLAGGSLTTESYFWINGATVLPYFSFGVTMTNSALMAPVTIPRLFAICLIFASLEQWYPLIPISIGGVLYTILSLLIIKKFKMNRPPKEFEGRVSENIRMMIMSSVFLPCYIVNPNWHLLTYLSILSGTILSLILSALIIISHVDENLLSKNMMTNPSLFQTTCGIVIGLIILGSLITAFQVWMNKRRHQTFLYQCAYGNVSEIERMLKLRDKKKYNFTEVNIKLRPPYDYQFSAIDYAIVCMHDEIVELITEHGEACGVPPPNPFVEFITNLGKAYEDEEDENELEVAKDDFDDL